MAGTNTITSANAVFLLTVPGVFSNAQQLQEFGVDDAFTTAASDATEVQVGVDAYGVAGYIPRAPRMTIRLLASSLSFVLFEDWIQAQDQLQDVLYASAVINYQSVKRKYTCYKGSLVGVDSLASARRVLQNREFGINWLPQGPGKPAIAAAPM